MLRRILIIVLVAVVIIAAFFAIRWFLNRDSVEEVPDVEATAVVEEGVPSDSSDGEDVGDVDSPESYPVPVEGEVAAPAEGEVAAPAEGEVAAPAEGEVAAPAEGEVAAPAEGEAAAPAEGEAAAPVEGEAGLGGDAAANDPNAGGGVPAEDDAALGDAVAVEPGDAVAVEPGVGGAPEISQPIAFVQPGVPTQHVAANQEWLTQLARCYGTTVVDIQAANNYACPDLIYPGYVVNISNPGNAGPITINEQPCFVYHTVQQGETLYSIANLYGIDYQWLARINAIYDYNYVYAGQQLVIPNPLDPVFTTPPAQPFYYSNCWYNYCPGWQYPPVAVPYGY